MKKSEAQVIKKDDWKRAVDRRKIKNGRRQLRGTMRVVIGPR